jgi:hypothetical protein
MYQPCTSTTVNLGEQRGVTVTRKRVVISPNAALPGSAETLGPGLITRRSQVQILPPPPRSIRSEALFRSPGRASLLGPCQRLVNTTVA